MAESKEKSFHDNSGLHGKAKKVLSPKNVQEVVNFVRSEKNICIRGNGTGLTGGSVPQKGDSVILMRSLEDIGEIDYDRRTIEVQAGVTLEELNNYLLPRKLEFPIRIPQEKTATIGSIIARNYTGMRAIKYGKITDWINWIEVVDAEGNISKKSRIDMSDFAGMEGTTGIITRASLKIKNFVERTADVISFDSFEDVVKKATELKRKQEVCAIELLDKWTSEILNLEFKYHLIVEYESQEGEFKDVDYLEKINLIYLAFHFMINKKDRAQIEDFKLLFDKFNKVFAFIESYDIPMVASISSGITHPFFDKKNKKHYEEIVKIVKRMSGSINTGLGIGLLKKDILDLNDKRLLVNMKRRLDPNNKFNQGKVVDLPKATEEKSEEIKIFEEKQESELRPSYVN